MWSTQPACLRSPRLIPSWHPSRPLCCRSNLFLRCTILWRSLPCSNRSVFGEPPPCQPPLPVLPGDFLALEKTRLVDPRRNLSPLASGPATAGIKLFKDCMASVCCAAGGGARWAIAKVCASAGTVTEAESVKRRRACVDVLAAVALVRQSAPAVSLTRCLPPSRRLSRDRTDRHCSSRTARARTHTRTYTHACRDISRTFSFFLSVRPRY